MRIELYGCLHENGMVRYKSPPGDEFSPQVFLEDVYDGDLKQGNGLGLLTDGRIEADGVKFNEHGMASGNKHLLLPFFCQIWHPGPQIGKV